MKALRRIVIACLPVGLVNYVQARRRHKELAEISERVRKLQTADRNARHKFSYEDAIAYLVSIKLPENHVRGHSIPKSSLEFCAQHIRARCSMGCSPIFGLHVGNFIGISLAYLTDACVKMHPKSCIYSIDPNIPHRNISHPQDYVVALLDHFGLTANASILVGYSLEKSVSNDGMIYDRYDPIDNFSREHSCENQLVQLANVSMRQMDFAVMDGNHSAEYLSREIRALEKLLKPSGLLILDDVTEGWHEIKKTYHALDPARWERLACDGRVGIARLLM